MPAERTAASEETESEAEPTCRPDETTARRVVATPEAARQTIDVSANQNVELAEVKPSRAEALLPKDPKPAPIKLTEMDPVAGTFRPTAMTEGTWYEKASEAEAARVATLRTSTLDPDNPAVPLHVTALVDCQTEASHAVRPALPPLL